MTPNFGATRSFFLDVPDDMVPFTKSPRKGFNTFKMSDGTFFNTRARIPAVQAAQYAHAELVSQKIKELVNSEAKRLQRDWYQGVPKFFNRRAFGMYFSKKDYPRGRRVQKYKRQTGRFRRVKGRIPRTMDGPFITGKDDNYLKRTEGSAIEEKYTKGRRQFPGRARTGQLRRALMITDLTVGGCTLFVRPCYAETGKSVDYVNVLMRGAKPKPGHPYIPELDRRISINGRIWRGIKQSYWLTWQRYFSRKVKEANDRIFAKVSIMLTEMRILEQRDLGLIRRGSKKHLNITQIEAERKSRKVKYGPVVPDSPYERNRSSVGNYGNVKRDPQVYYNKQGPFNPFLPFKGGPLPKRF